MSFRRALGPFDATMVVVGGIIGSGIFINPYIVAQRLSSGGLEKRGLMQVRFVPLIGSSQRSAH